jgi:hypothetical protein
MTKPKKDYAKLGVPADYLNDKGGFRGPGWDAKAKSALVAEALAHEEAHGGRKGSPAHKTLARLEWTRFLDAKRERLAAKPKAKVRVEPEPVAEGEATS